ncbi:MAG: hypothetical protein HFE64_03415 [Lachnospiraceae bacterium]|jgi:hypothetical protein|nr:hypothetical protein [Lachnospiraceae bacterium]
MDRDPQQELFTELKFAIEALGYDVYDSVLPPKNTPYPFVYLGDFQQNDAELKNAVFGAVYPMIHVWHNNLQQRGTVSEMMLNIKTACRKIEKTDNFAWIIGSMNSRIIPDNTTAQPLLHGVIEPTFRFS